MDESDTTRMPDGSGGLGVGAGGTLGAIVEAMRPTHWVKNAFVAAPLCVVWLMIGYWLGRKQSVLARHQPLGTAAVEPAPA